LRRETGLDRLPDLHQGKSFIVVSNHRSYFDLFVVTMVLFKKMGLKNRMIFPVRSNFFYDNPFGFFVNGLMSWWSMYPPIFRQKKKAALNHTAMSELGHLLGQEGTSAGLHPEGTRNKGPDPYSLLPAQSGVGRAIYHSRVPVLPVFINGLGNALFWQVLSNFVGRGRRVWVVFGAPIDFGSLLDAPASARTYRAIAEHTIDAIRKLGEEERQLRAGETQNV
jgi:1-acyl-sn-glycerol-3-phosphate acyltransferase